MLKHGRPTSAAPGYSDHYRQGTAKVPNLLTLQYDKLIYLIEDSAEHRKLIGRYIDVYEIPDGRIELHAEGGPSIPYVTCDRLSEDAQGVIVENKRLGHALQIAQLVQDQRGSRRGRSAPARTNRGESQIQLKAAPGTIVQHQIDATDLEAAITRSAGVLTAVNGSKGRLN